MTATGRYHGYVQDSVDNDNHNGAHNGAHDEDHDDDRPIGSVITRRAAMRLFTAPAILWLAGCSNGMAKDPETPLIGSCVVRPQLTEGPFYVDEKLNRSDVRSDSATTAVKAGALLALTFNVSQVSGNDCTPLPNAIVDIWQTDALGNYSDVQGFVGQDFLRGFQVTDADGKARFTTIYPGWYPGRTVHIHFKVRSSATSTSTYEFTSQLFFQDDVTDEVFKQAPYNTRGNRNTRNSNDGIYGSSKGQTLVAAITEAAGLAAEFSLALSV